MRDFELHGRGHGRGFGRHRMGKGLIIGAVIFIVLGLLVMSLWNALLPAILGVKAIGFWQALGILVLSRILFGGLGFRPGMFGAHRRMHERWMNMTPEQREAFILSSVAKGLVATDAVTAAGTAIVTISAMTLRQKRRTRSERDESRGGGRIHADVGAKRLSRPAESLHSRTDVRAR